MSESSTRQLPLVQDDLSDAQSSAGCCGFTKLMRSGYAVAFLLLATVISTATAGFFAGRASKATVTETTLQPNVYFPPIDATAAVSSEKFSMCTGLISDRAEGLFVLDHNSGLLQCSIIYPRLGRFLGLFTINVAADVGAGGKGGRYMMVTGLVDFPSSSNRPAAPSVIYVLDTATGNYACYGVPFDRVTMNNNRAQQGNLVLISKGTANPVIDRDDLN